MKKLPESFCVVSNRKHELWNEYIQWLNEKEADFNGNVGFAYGIEYGKPRWGGTWGEEITLEEWHEAVNAKSEFPEPVFVTKSGIEIYDEVEMLVWDNTESLARKEKITAKNDNFYFTLSSDGFIATWRNAKRILEEVEVTMEEIAKWKGVDVKQIKIK